MATARFSFTFCWPIISCSRRGRSLSSNEASSSTTPAETIRSRSGFLDEGISPDGTQKPDRLQSRLFFGYYRAGVFFQQFHQRIEGLVHRNRNAQLHSKANDVSVQRIDFGPFSSGDVLRGG